MPARSSEIERKKMSGSQLLVVDDEEVNRDVMYALLSKSGFKVTAAAFGAEAISLASKKRFCSILMDIDMPEMNGFEAARQIRQLERFPITSHRILRRRDSFGIRLG
jgi:CheY-like chemotaxis protein